MKKLNEYQMKYFELEDQYKKLEIAFNAAVNQIKKYEIENKFIKIRLKEDKEKFKRMGTLNSKLYHDLGAYIKVTTAVYTYCTNCIEIYYNAFNELENEKDIDNKLLLERFNTEIEKYQNIIHLVDEERKKYNIFKEDINE